MFQRGFRMWQNHMPRKASVAHMKDSILMKRYTIYNLHSNTFLSHRLRFFLYFWLTLLSHGKVATSVDKVGKMVLKEELYRYINWTKTRHIRMMKSCLQNYWRYPFVWGLWFLTNTCSVQNYVLVNMKLIRQQWCPLKRREAAIKSIETIYYS